MATCQVCGKSAKIGRNSKHHRGVSSRQFAHRAKKVSRTFKPNIQKTTIRVGGLKVSLKLCAKCLKTMKKKQRIKAEKVKSAPRKSPNKKKKTAKK